MATSTEHRPSLTESGSSLPDTLTAGVASMVKLVRRYPVPAAIGLAALVVLVAKFARRQS
jgi:hypothetical protein